MSRLITRRAAVAGGSLLLSWGAGAQPREPAKAQPVKMIMPGNVPYLAKLFIPAKVPAPAIIVVPDGWGLTPDFEAMGATLSSEGMMALVLDLAQGKTAENAQEAEAAAKKIDGEKPNEAIAAWYDWLRNRIECDRRASAFGFGPGGRWAVQGSLYNGATGIAIWCARVDQQPKDLHSIYETFVGHFSDRDAVSGAVLVADLQQRLKAAQREGVLYRYTSKPGFYNPRSPDYDKPDASLAWRRTMAVYKKMWSI